MSEVNMAITVEELSMQVQALEERLAKLEALLEKAAPVQKAPREKEEVYNVGVKGKYRFLADFLHNHGGDSITMTFKQIEELIGNPLPSSAYNHRAYWSNTDTHSISKVWMQAGYMTTYVNLLSRKVIFERKRHFD